MAIIYCEHIEFEDGEPNCEECHRVLCQECRVRVEDMVFCSACAECTCGAAGIAICDPGAGGCGACVCADHLFKSADVTLCMSCVREQRRAKRLCEVCTDELGNGSNRRSYPGSDVAKQPAMIVCRKCEATLMAAALSALAPVSYEGRA